MFKAGFLCAFFIIAASATHYQELDNLIEYGERPYESYVLPYAYKDQLVVKPLPDVIVPALPVAEVGFSKLGLITKVASFGIGLVKKVVVFLLVNAPALILGTLAAFGVCKFTPICSKLSSIKSLYEVPIELRSFATPERLAKASDFVQKAIRKYRSLQKEEQ